MDSYFTLSERCPVFHGNEFRDLPPNERSSYRFYAGHLQNLPLELVSSEIPTITVLREPRQQLASLIAYHVKMHVCPSGAGKTPLREAALRLRDKFLLGDLCSKWPAINNQTKCLAALDFMAFIETTREHYELAGASLDRCVAVGTVERLQEFVDLLALQRGWSHADFDRRENESQSGGLLDGVDSDLLNRLLSLDDALYARANARLDADIARAFGRGATPDKRTVKINSRAKAGPSQTSNLLH